MKVFLDTNVWIDFAGERMPFYDMACGVLSLADAGKAHLALSTLSIINANYVCCERSGIPLHILKNKLEQLRDIITVTPITEEDISNSYNSGWSDFEDGVQYSSALRWGADCIVTRNKKDFFDAAIPVLTPQELLEQVGNE